MSELPWWQRAVFYQVYLRSFADGNGDGIGDLIGLTDRLDYLQNLGVDALWLSPFYPSPLFDCGYDIADYTAVAAEYGTLADFQQFLAGAHERGIRVILDLVLNHTSDQHPWFIQSRSSRDNPRHGWYIWRSGKDGGPPNNWASFFGGSAWEYAPATGQYYYHIFFKQQPELNWRNPEVRQAMFDVVRFWLDLGVDGFRLDAIDTIFEDPALPDHTAGLSQRELYRACSRAKSEEEVAQLAREWEAMFGHQLVQPGVHELMQELRAVADEYPDRVLMGETDDVRYYGDGHNELHLVFNFPLMEARRLAPACVRANQRERLAALPPGAWPCNTLGNHDTPRIYNRYGDGQRDAELARLALALMLTLRGTPVLYYGEEIGMTDLELTDIGQFRDWLGIWAYQVETGELRTPPAEALAHAIRHGRDKCRAPMQWTDGPQAGFCPPGTQTWLPVNPNCADGINVAGQSGDPSSLLSFYRSMLHLRRQTLALIAGDYRPLHEDAKDYLAFLRCCEGDGQACLVVLNMSGRAHTLGFDLDARTARLIFSSHPRDADADDLSRFAVAPFEIYVGELADDCGCGASSVCG